MLVFEERGKPEYPEKNLLQQRRDPMTNLTRIWRKHRDLIPGMVGGTCHHQCIIPCSPIYSKNIVDLLKEVSFRRGFSVFFVLLSCFSPPVIEISFSYEHWNSINTYFLTSLRAPFIPGKNSC